MTCCDMYVLFGIQCTVMYLVFVSIKVTKYRFPCVDVIGKGPHTSDDMWSPPHLVIVGGWLVWCSFDFS